MDHSPIARLEASDFLAMEGSGRGGFGGSGSGQQEGLLLPMLSLTRPGVFGGDGSGREGAGGTNG